MLFRSHVLAIVNSAAMNMRVHVSLLSRVLSGYNDKVCSPGGTTIAGLMDLERTGLTHSVVSSIDTTIAKAKKL